MDNKYISSVSRVSMVMSACMVGILVGCSFVEPKAEDLIAGIGMDSASCDFAMDIDIAVSQSGFSLDLGIDIDADVEADANTVYVDGVVTTSALGEKTSDNFEVYCDLVDGDLLTYLLDSDGCDFDERETDLDRILPSGGTKVKKDVFILEKCDGTYVVSAENKGADLAKIFDDTGLFGGYGDFAFDEDSVSAYVEFVFDAKTRDLTDMSIEFSASSDVADISVRAELTDIETGTGSVKVPKDVKSAASMASVTPVTPEIPDFTLDYDDIQVYDDMPDQVSRFDEEPVFDVPAFDDAEQVVIDDVKSGDKLSQVWYGRDVTSEDVFELTGGAADSSYMQIKVCTLFNYYSYDDILEYAAIWSSLDDDSKTSIALLVYSGVLNADDLVSVGVDAGELNAILGSF